MHSSKAPITLLIFNNLGGISKYQQIWNLLLLLYKKCLLGLLWCNLIATPTISRQKQVHIHLSIKTFEDTNWYAAIILNKKF